MKLEDMVRTVVSGAVDEYLSTQSDPVPGTGSTAALMSIPAEASGRHVHLSPDDVEKLFGPGYQLTPKRPLSQPGQYLSEERVTLIGPKGTFKNVAILGPPRGHTQVEVSKTDARELGLNPPVALSGDLSHAADMLIASKDAFLMAEQSLIVAQVHIHMSPEEAAAAGLKDGDRVDVRLETERPLTFNNVVIRSGPGHALALHMDFDEANACGYVNGDKATILRKCEPFEAAPAPAAAPAEPVPSVRVFEPAPAEEDLGPGDVVLSTTFLTENQVRDALARNAKAVVVGPKTVVSPLAGDLLRKHGIALKRL